MFYLVKKKKKLLRIRQYLDFVYLALNYKSSVYFLSVQTLHLFFLFFFSGINGLPYPHPDSSSQICAVLNTSVWNQPCRGWSPHTVLWGVVGVFFWFFWSFLECARKQKEQERRNERKMTVCGASTPEIISSPLKWLYGGLWEWIHVIESGKVRAVCRGEIQGGRPRWRALRQVRSCSLHSKVCIFLGVGG